jgi:hypothetical protein
MSARPCTSPIAFASLVDYWLGERADEREQALEDHFFACGHCTERLEELARLGAGVRAAFRSGAVHAVVSAPFLDKLKREGVRVREYRLAPGESVNCTVGADEFVISRLSADLAGVKRLDVFEDIDDGKLRLAMHDVPFDAAAGEVLVCPPPALLRKLPAHVGRVRLVAVDEAGSRTLGEYTFNHSPTWAERGGPGGSGAG